VVPNWRPAGRLMHFPWLDRSGMLVPAYTIGWRIEDNPDEWSRRFLAFKAGRQGDVYGAAYVLRDALGELIRERNIDPSRTGLATALSSRRTKAEAGTPLYNVGKWIAEQHGVRWLPDAFEKEVHRALRTISGGANRDAEVDGKYRSARMDGIDRLVILDDFITRGATLREMRRAFTETNGEIDMVALALAKNEKAAYASAQGVEVNNDHIPADWDSIWRREQQKQKQKQKQKAK
jgi:hypothetical protein